jgi:hypothetical protein
LREIIRVIQSSFEREHETQEKKFTQTLTQVFELCDIFLPHLKARSGTNETTPIQVKVIAAVKSN